MSLFQPSTKAVSSACQEIADSVGASGDADMTNRAWRSLCAGISHFNNKSKWNFLRAEAAPVAVFAPFSILNLTASGGSASVSAASGHGLLPDDFILGSGFANGTRVSTTAVTSFSIFGTVTGFTGTATGNASAERDMYDLPSDWKAPYTVMLLGSQRRLNYVGRRIYDSAQQNEQNTSTPDWYDLFMVGSRGRIRLLTPPSASDTLLMRYYRRMASPTTSATADALDIVQEYELYLLAWAKWHFLTDKGEGRLEQAKTWFVLAQDGLKTMLADQTQIPDEGLCFVPGHYAFGQWNDTSTRWLDWNY